VTPTVHFRRRLVVEVHSGEGLISTQLSRWIVRWTMSALGREEPHAPAGRNDRFGFNQQTFAGAPGNDAVAPKAAMIQCASGHAFV
jgi:hypothetical protein